MDDGDQLLTDSASSPHEGPRTGVQVQVTDRSILADGVLRLTLTRPDGARLPDWSPGSHIDLVLPDGTVRQYSLCGDRWDPLSYQVAVLREPDGRGGSAYVHDKLSVGSLVGVGGPRNNFALAPAKHYLFIAGGIGITPLLPMIDAAERLDVDWQLLYGGRSRGSMAFLDELARYGERVQVLPEDECGLLPVQERLHTPRADTRVYCCGPAPLLAAVEAACASWPPHSLYSERFVAREQGAPMRSTPFTVVLNRSGTAVTVPPDVSVLEAVRAAGADVLSSCAEGTCGTCETAVLAGTPEHRDSILDDADRDTADCMFICVSRSRSDQLVLDL